MDSLTVYLSPSINSFTALKKIGEYENDGKILDELKKEPQNEFLKSLYFSKVLIIDNSQCLTTKRKKICQLDKCKTIEINESNNPMIYSFYHYSSICDTFTGDLDNFVLSDFERFVSNPNFYTLPQTKVKYFFDHCQKKEAIFKHAEEAKNSFNQLVNKTLESVSKKNYFITDTKNTTFGYSRPLREIESKNDEQKIKTLEKELKTEREKNALVLSKLETEKTKLTNENMKMSLEIKQLKEENNNDKLKIDKLKYELQQQNSALENEKNKSQSHEEDANIVEKEYVSLIEKMKKTIDKKSIRIKKLESEIEGFNKANKENSAKLIKTEEELENTKTKMADYRVIALKARQNSNPIPTEAPTKTESVVDFYKAAEEGNTEIILQLKAPIRPTQFNQTLLHFAAASGNKECVAHLLKIGYRNESDSFGNTPVEWADSRGIAELIMQKNKL